MIKPLFIKRLLISLLLVLLLILLIGVAWYFYKTKIIKRPVINPSTCIISDSTLSSEFPVNKALLLVDFETYANTDELNADYAYSGKYSYKVYGKNAFSAVISKTVADAGKKELNRVGFSSYVYIFPENFDKLKADLVFSIVDQKDNNIVWKGVSLNPIFMEAGKWIKVSGASDIDIQTIPNDGIIKVYLWNDSKTNILIDDIAIVLGKDEPLTGDTTYCDNTPGSTWTKQFNMPPYPFQYLVREEINNGQSAYLIKNKMQTAGAFTPETKIYTGNFYNPSNLLDKILTIENNVLNTYSYCENFKIFRHDMTLALTENDSVWQKSLLLTGKFRGKPTDDILMIDTINKHFQLLYIGNTLANTCQSNTCTIKLNKAWEGGYQNFNLQDNPNIRFLTFYVSPSQKASLLFITNDGNWSIFDFQKSEWSCLAKSTQAVGIWDNTKYNHSIHTGFYSNTATTQILCIYNSEKSEVTNYSILNFDRNNKSFIENSERTKIYGLDTLKISDDFICINDKNEPHKTVVLRIDNTWRNDIKALVFKDTTYEVLSLIDFKGFKKDFNPKFYEYLLILPGYFTNAHKISLLTLCYNYKEKNKNNIKWAGHSFLPNAVHIFSPSPLNQKDFKNK